ncbi:MAG: HNH/ENDO VII family nuclease [Saccharopolyspora sp.]|nr:HNH/ENDO VII family nuclease [Saccharopolyspora sp.]
MDALSAHANGLRTAGTGFADTGADVHSTWQGLAPAYLAPESEQLLQATRPVTETAGNVGRDVEQVAGALQRYADEVRPLQQHLRDLKAQAEALVADIHSYENQKPSTSELAASAKTGIVPDKDWTDDGDLTDRDAQLMSAVNQAVADWMAAQRRCANAITGLYGGRHYTADNADGNRTGGEYGYSADQLTAAAGSDQGLPWGRTEDTSNPLADIGHTALDLGGLIPGIGELADGANAAWYAAEGDHLNAGLSAAAMIPIGGWAATGSKLAGKGAKAARTYKRPSGFRKNVRDTVWNDAEKAAPDGQVRDPSSNEVISKEEPWHMGHRPGFEFRKHQSSAEERGITRKQFLDEHNNPDHYRPEKPQHNSGHRGEDHTDSYFGP